MKSKNRQYDFDVAYMKMALVFSSLSYATRRKVGCVIVSENDQIISQGFNGTPSGFDNICEWEWCDKYQKKLSDINCTDCIEENRICIDCNYRHLKTKPYVVHAESNAITKCAKSHNSTIGTTMYVTLSPCIECAKLIISSGIKRVVYYEEYHDISGLSLLKEAGIDVQQLKFNNGYMC